jgi:peptidoglycan/xylan/chitin deacetylase (PgdA/CDA1 family)
MAPHGERTFTVVLSLVDRLPGAAYFHTERFEFSSEMFRTSSIGRRLDRAEPPGAKMIKQLSRLFGHSGAVAASPAVLATAALVAAAPLVPAQAATSGHAASRCPNGYVGLTYDDGPTAATLPALLSALRAAHARATFFNQGNNAELNPDLVRAEQRAGMWIGSHTVTHPHLTQIGEPAAFNEIAGAQRRLRKITGHWPALFRPPFGETGDQVRTDEARLKVLEVLWTVDSRDWAGATTPEIVAAAATLEPGGIILMHDWAQPSIDAVPQIVRDLRDRGLCPGKIVFTPRDIPFGTTVFHATAVAP